MKPQPDQFFQDRLANYSRPAPTAAWSRIEAGLQKKKKVFFWRAIAASALVLSVASYAAFHFTNNDSSHVTAQNPRTILPAPADNGTDSTTLLSSAAEGKIRNTAPAAEKEKVAKEKLAVRRSEHADAPAHITMEKITTLAQVSENNEVSTVPAFVPEESTIIDDPSIENVAAITTEDVQPAFREEGKNITMVMSREESKNYLVKNEQAEATPDKKKSSTLKQVLKKARDLKTNQDPFGDLRQMKNEILALNFKSDKRGQKK